MAIYSGLHEGYDGIVRDQGTLRGIMTVDRVASNCGTPPGH
jgi:hypothetical protein